MVKKKSEPVKGLNLMKLKTKREKAPNSSEVTQDTTEGKSTDETTDPSSEQPDDDAVSTTRSPLKKPQPARKETNRTTTEKIKKRPKKTKVFKEIAKFQKSTNLLIPKAPFLRLVREIMMERSGASRDGGGMRITPVALEALRESSECYLTSVFEDAYLIALHSKRVTLMPRDIELLMQIRHE